ncbi:hypothetical protein PCHDS_000520300, partial [Plasmodium chabaudi adami]
MFQKRKPKRKPRRSKHSSNGEEKHKESKKDAQQSTKKESHPSESKASDSSQNTTVQAQILPKLSQTLQEASPNNKNTSSNVTGAPKDMENVSVNQVNNQEIAKTRSRRGLSLQQNHHTSNHNESLSQLSETTVENISVESSDKLTDTRNGPAKRIKRDVPQDESPNQEGNSEKKTPDSLSLENPEGESSNIESIIDYSVNIFKTYSSLFNNTVNMIEDYIQDIVMSKINDIIDKITKYQPIIQKVGSTIAQIQIVNDHQSESKKSTKEKAEHPSPTQTTEETQIGSDGILLKLVSEPGDNVMGLSGNIAKLLSSNFEGYKLAIMAFMAVSIPIALVIMYK